MLRAGRFFLEPKGLLREILGKSCIALGDNYPKMYAEYAKLVKDNRDPHPKIHIMSQLIDRYMREITPQKAESSYRHEIRRCQLLKHVFGQMKPGDITKPDIYQFIDWRSQTAKVGVNREIALLSAILRKAERWGVIHQSPCRDIEYNKETPRSRYISHDEFLAFRGFVFEKNKLVAAYMDFKYITGLRVGDILRLEKSRLLDVGLNLEINKTKVKRLMEWSDTLCDVTRRLIEANWQPKNKSRYRISSEYLMHTRKGTKYTESGWRAIFYRLMREAIEKGIIKESFCDHDIRAKTGSDAKSAEEARKLLAHLNLRVTERHYRRDIEHIQPLM